MTSETKNEGEGSRLDGLALGGGGDIDTDLYDGELRASVRIDPD